MSQFYTAGFDIGASTLRYALFNSDYKICASTHQYLPESISPEALVKLMYQVHCDCGLAGNDLIRSGHHVFKGVGVGIAAQLSANGSMIICAPNLNFRHVPFESLLYEAFGVPIWVKNDLNAIVLGEMTHGAAQGHKHILGLYVGTGFGGALIVDRKLYQGATGVAGEVGHIKVVPGGRLCGCGQRGCVEAYVSGAHLLSQLQENEEGVANLLGEDLGTMSDHSLLKRVDTHVAEVYKRESDDELCQLWHRCTDMLAMTIANAVTLTNPDLLLLGGGVLEQLPEYRRLTLKKIDALILTAARHNLEIGFGVLADMAGVYGSVHGAYL